MLTRRQFLKMCAGTIVGAATMNLPSIAEGAVRSIPVLLYHRVGCTKDSLTVTPERFARDMKTLTDYGYNTITLNQFQEFLLDQSVNIPYNPILISFDDGYLDNYQNAFPILKKYGMTGAFFIITGMIGEPDRLGREHLLEMHQSGMCFGSHTVSHRSLGELTLDEMQYEMVSSKAVLEDILETQVKYIAYPKGSFNNGTLSVVKETNYLGGFTVKYGKCARNQPAFTLKRIPVFSYNHNIISLISGAAFA